TVFDDLHSTSDTTVADARKINKPPVAVAGGPYNGLVGQEIHFNGLASHDPEGDSLTYHWDFGDGFEADGPTPTHFYQFSTTFTVILTVRDATGVGRDTTTATIIFASADVFLTQTQAPDPVVVGGTLTYSITVGNHGPVDALNAGMFFQAFGSR